MSEAPRATSAGSVPGAQTAGRALRLLRAVVDSELPPLLGELADAVGINRPAAYRLARELEEQGLVQVLTQGDERRYVSGPALIAMAARVLGKIDHRVAAEPFLLRISETTGETVALHLRDRRYRVCVSAVQGRHPIRRVVPLGERLPLYAGPTGKVILAWLPEPERSAVLAWAADEGEPVASYVLDGIRSRGFYAAVGDRVAGVGGLSVPVFDASGVVAAVTISGPGDRWSQRAMEDAGPRVVEECAALSLLLGHDPARSALNETRTAAASGLAAAR